MCENGPGGSTAIVNPRNGPVKRQAKIYLPAMAYCHEHGWKVIGYVFTRYGKRGLKAVENAINHYYLWYPTIQGIFLDEMAEQPSAKVETYYKTLESLVHEKGGEVVGNPGDTASTAWQLNDVDQVVTFEGPASAFAAYHPAQWVLEAEPSQIANLVFAATGALEMEAACAQAQSQNAGSLYVTDLPEEPNPYASLASYWPTETEVC